MPARKISPFQQGHLDGLCDAPYIGACCYNHAHTGIEVQYLPVNKPPWQGMLTGNERFSCPGCGRCMHHSWATIDRRPNPQW
jgi:uncharacterized cysteine cluster protein YcgN (CxxCxxCC family)